MEILEARAAADLVGDGDTVAMTGSGGGLLEAEAVLAAIEARFLETGHPRDLTFVHALGVGDVEHSTGTNHFAHEGMVRRVIAGHWSWSPRMQDLVAENRIEAYCFPSGVISLLLREIGAGRPGLFTHVGLGTFVDPRRDGGGCNPRSNDSLVELVEFDGRELLRYKPFRVDVGVVRGTFADPDGNISTIQEPVDLDAYAVALAAHNGGGRVIAQVREAVGRHALAPRTVRIPGVLVDAVVVDPNQKQTHRAVYEPAVSGEFRSAQPLKLTAAAAQSGIRRVIARRAAREVTPGAVVNFGFGISASVPNMLAERGDGAGCWLTIEQGIHNGAIIEGPLFGAGVNPDAIVSSLDQFDFYSGRGLDITCLGMGEMDAEGNVNVSHLNGRLIGPGGFIDISQNARKVVFCGTFDTKGSKVEVVDGGLRVLQPGHIRKLVGKVENITFSGAQARRQGQEVVYVTERAVFKLRDGGVELTEIAPGVDLDRDILGAMDFAPIVAAPRIMDPALFAA